MCSDTNVPGPDPAIGQAAMANVNLAKEMTQYFRERDAAQAPRQARMDDLTEKLANQQMSSSAFNDQQARDQWRRYQAHGIPAEDVMYADAAGYDSKANLDQAAGEAGNTVAAMSEKAREASRRTLARMGVNPADGRALANEQDMGAQTALAEAAAMNGARDQRRQMGVMLRKDAASFGRGATGTAAQTFGVAGAAGGQASGAVGAAIGAANATTGTMGQGFTGAMQGNSSAGSILNSLYGNQIQAAGQNNDSGLLSGISGLASGIGAAGGIGKFFAFSDENMKEDRKPVSGRAALRGMRGIQVEKWKYKPGSAGDDGGQPHVGAMAQDLNAKLGEEVAPGGKVVDVISALGTTMAAVKELDKKVGRMAARGVKR
jgi:hypothetical protein